MYYRFVCLLEELRNFLKEDNVFYSLDMKQRDDIMCFYHRGNIKAICLLNKKIVIDMLSNTKRSCNGIKIVLDYYEESNLFELINRYTNGGKKMAELKMEEVKGELQQYSDDDLYNINSWGADLSFREIITMYEDDELLKPELQRKYVWNRAEASRFIDSILLGLPVPSIFLAKEPDETKLIIDGFQRIMTVFDYVKGIFSGDGKVFKLSNSENINMRWRGKAFAELDTEEKRRIKGTTIHAIIFEQKYPRNDTGMFQIFERINTGGRTLKPQEIRNCVYQGKCNKLLFKLNRLKEWREILNLEDGDARMSDLELILRFFAMSDLRYREEADLKQINLAKYLNQYMREKTEAADDEIEQMENKFIAMIKACKTAFGKSAFKNLKKNTDIFTDKINPAIFDAVSVATLYALEKGVFNSDTDYTSRYIELLQNPEFMDAASHRTTNVENIKKRIGLATEKVYGVKYEG